MPKIVVPAKMQSFIMPAEDDASGRVRKATPNAEHKLTHDHPMPGFPVYSGLRTTTVDPL